MKNNKNFPGSTNLTKIIITIPNTRIYLYIITPVKVEYGWILYEWADVYSRAEGE